MKKKLIILLIAFVTLGINANCYDTVSVKYPVEMQAAASDKEVIDMLKAFYTDYITAVAGTDMKKPDIVLAQYCTPSLLKKLKKVDDDQILKVQDANIKMLDNLTIVKNKKLPNSYIVRWQYSDYHATIILSVVKQNEKYKVNNVR